MPVSFQSIPKNSFWDRNQLAQLWGYRSFHALARGVFTPANERFIVLFVTESKQASATPYHDELSGDTLQWNGETGHQNDLRIQNAAASGDEIHVFYRELHHSPFQYLGEVTLQSSRLSTSEPSNFTFRLGK